MGAPADEQRDPWFQVGQVLAGRYWLQEHLGRGAMGEVEGPVGEAVVLAPVEDGDRGGIPGGIQVGGALE